MYIPDVVPSEDRKSMVENAGYGGNIGYGESFAVIVIDMTNQFVLGKYPNGFPETGLPTVEQIADLLEVTKENGIRAYYSRPMSTSADHPLKKGLWSDTGATDQTEFIDEEMNKFPEPLSPSESDVVFEKCNPSAFFGTQLHSMLNKDRIDTLIITGMTTSGCIRASVVDAFSLNYRVNIPEECVADRSQISHEINLFDMDMKYADVLPTEEILNRVRSSE